jgi:hypothetical protein
MSLMNSDCEMIKYCLKWVNLSVGAAISPPESKPYHCTIGLPFVPV